MATLISLRSAVKSFGARTVLDGLDLEVDEAARIGVVGQNGSGKSTLLRILAGLDDPDSDPPVRRRGMSAAYLPQLVAADTRTPIEICHAARPDIARVEAELERCAAALGDPAVAADLRRMQRTLDRQQRLLDEFDQLDGHAFSGNVRSILDDLGVIGGGVRPPAGGALGRQAQAGGAGGVPRAGARPAPPRRARDPPRRLPAQPGRGARARRSRARSSWCPTTATCSTRPCARSPRSSAAGCGCGPATTRRTTPRASSSCTSSRRPGTHSRRRSPGSRTPSAATSNGRAWSTTPRHTTRARNTQRRIDRMDKVERPVLERRKIALQLRSGVRGGKRVAEWRDVTVAFGADPALIGVDLTVFRGERIGVIGDNGSGQERAGEAARRGARADRGRDVGGAVDRGRLPAAGARAGARAARRRSTRCGRRSRAPRRRRCRRSCASSSATSSAASR